MARESKIRNYAIRRFGEPVNSHVTNSNNIIFTCPNCNRPKLYVNLGNGMYNCFRCGNKGKLKIKNTLGEVYKQYYNTVDSAVHKKENEVFFVIYPHESLNSLQIDCLRNRGLTDDDIEYYHITSDGDTGRIIIPNYVKGIFTDFYVGWEYRKRLVTDSNPKYLNNDQCTKKGSLLFNGWRIPKDNNYVVLCEGVFDAITAGKHAVASLGCNLTEKQVQLLIELQSKKIIIAYDGDEPGVKGSDKVIQYLYKYHYKGEVEYVPLPINIDINDMGRENFWNYYHSHKYIIDMNSVVSRNLPMLLFNR